MLSIVAISLVLLPQLVIPLEASEHSYVGSKKRKMCHLQEWQSWSETKMGKAYVVLKSGANAAAKIVDWLLSKPVAAKYSFFPRKIQGLPHYLADFFMGDY